MGGNVGDVAYYHAFATWRLACILDGVVDRYRAGAMGEDGGFDVESWATQVSTLAGSALDLLGSSSSWKKKAGIAAASVVALFVVLGLLGAGDIIDLPAWANVPGVDLPIVGDKDAIDCKLEQVDGTRNVEIRIVDGDDSTYPDYVHVWNNGNLIEPGQVDRQADNFLVVPSTEGTNEQFYSISIEPVREGRVFCESIILE